MFLSLIPALITIILTFKTKKLIISLFAGVLSGTIIHNGLIGGITAIGEYTMRAISDKESAYTLSFFIAFGSLADLIQMAGGISGFSDIVGKWIKNEKSLLLWAWLLSLITFFHSSFHTIAVGTVLTPSLKKLKLSGEKLAFILSVTSTQLILLIPIATSYLGYMVTLVTNNIKHKGISEKAYSILVKSIAWNFFPWAMLIIGIGITLFGLGFGKLKLGKTDENNTELTKGHIEKEKAYNTSIEEYPEDSKNLIIPIIILLSSTIFFFWWTGRPYAKGFINALAFAKFNVSIFSGIMLTLLLTSLYYMYQKISIAEIEAHIIRGGEKVLSLVMILILSWALTSITQDLGINSLINGPFIRSVPKFLMPAVLFIISGLVAYAMGSSWATWALMMPLAINFSINSSISVPLMVGTVWSGGAVADVISPLAAKMADISYGEHLTTSFPYLILGIAITIVSYLIVGLRI
ncbi:Na+/H+ antiporter NhaC [Clostridium acetobutylicum]|uniref:Membrane protein, possible transporter n=1 Tax=Clostridium acetobutylicum (strain ATCC 824 / DSM 792 / JCM 1419 / IAM 19013 / LMG 5710 / NBRC 13948 / NRRL B-527 / VKM B-1787 / 2291 / W) TaxID=272562 RepID=Q97TG1_CLOAB|nr:MULTISPECIES: Na+/H+ antiporter NhaC family protein [Clostridium]AAK76885.1 Membrane protein, possible transporter [Clostridium acetobutylicum ATCC 824]ADZ22922.1 Membrane protein, possible transporter [Clostridium acetobutylicum EA 2018]AEI34881.1 membrane protein, transporter [Clostridium acetobutylicum DSM 1731]AWV82427.1 Na+/H+ antiporter NhaC family protein [Clostridium acetobutylicum]MBC2395729.1 Na+/H+ antiporter NhaC family protein [Clostridium acetobutylicum]